MTVCAKNCVRISTTAMSSPRWKTTTRWCARWVTLPARLRQDFHITTGITIDHIADFQSKSRMKHFYAQAGIPCARWQMADTLDSALAFAAQYGYPLICKPDVGAGAS